MKYLTEISHNFNGNKNYRSKEKRRDLRDSSTFRFGLEIFIEFILV